MSKIIAEKKTPDDLAPMKHISIKHITNVHSDALKSLAFYLDELSIFQERLETLSIANSGIEVAIQIEHFQNQFIIHKDQMEEISHLLRENLKTISSEIRDSSGYLDEPLLAQNFRINEQFLEEEKLFREMKTAFYQFAAKWM